MFGLFTTCVTVFFLILSQGFSYDVSEKEYDFIDTFEDRLFSIIDERDSVSPEKVESLLGNILDKKISEKNRAIIEVILDDLQYTYYLGAYADEIHTPDDCWSDEYFDAKDQRCYFDDGEYDYENEEDFTFTEPHHGTHHWEWELGEDEIIAEYNISGDSIALASWVSEQRHLDVWEWFTSIIPVHARKDFKKYKIIDSSESDSGAHVEQDEEDNTKWNMTINLDSFYPGGVADEEYGLSTLIHEFAHVLTLNKTQVRYFPITENESALDRFAENCQTNLLQEWCLNEDAYLDDFIDTFWSDEEELRQVREEELDIYTGNEDSFITDYAATNPGEDIAESFTYFVLQSKPTGDTVAEEKLLFFYQYKELENLRKQIRTRLEKLGE